MFFQGLFLLLGFTLLIKGADWMVNGSVSLAKHYRISELVIGLTIVAFGTSAPELVVNIVSSLKGLNDITIGNIVGSNLFNLMLILGISGLVFPITVQIKTIWNEIPFSLLAAVLLIVLANLTFNQGEALSIGRIDGILLLVLFIFFLVYIFRHMRVSLDTLETDYKKIKPSKSFLLIVTGLVALVIGSRVVVENAVKM